MKNEDIVPVPYNRGQVPEGAKQVDADKMKFPGVYIPEGAVPADSFVWDDEDAE